MIEKTLVLIKPDGVERGIVGRIISRFEDAGIKIAALRMVKVEKDTALKHYDEDLAERRGEKIRDTMVNYVSGSVVVAAVLEGVNVIEVVRKITGDTEPKSALPGTIRGDFTHMSYDHADKTDGPVKNVIHASSSKEDAEKEIPLWFSEEEIQDYEGVHEKHSR